MTNVGAGGGGDEREVTLLIIGGVYHILFEGEGERALQQRHKFLGSREVKGIFRKYYREN